MKKLAIILSVILIPIFFSCEKISDVIEESGLTNEEIIQGLKEALRVGTDTAVSIVSQLDGYYGDPIIKILLPPEADIIVNNANSPLLTAIGVSQMIDDVILSINRSAEDAATEAASIFINAISSMTISDGLSILNGSDSAATHYLRITTNSDLHNLFKPKMQTSLNKPIVGGTSAQDTWTSLTNQYNSVANTLAGQLAGLTPVTTQLDDFITSKALDGLYIKIAEEEKDIRNNPIARINDILKKVFGP